MANTTLDNLKRWMESGSPEQWVDAHAGRWSYSDWLALLAQLQQGEYWPMSEDDIGAHLESLAAQYRQSLTLDPHNRYVRSMLDKIANLTNSAHPQTVTAHTHTVSR